MHGLLVAEERDAGRGDHVLPAVQAPEVEGGVSRPPLQKRDPRGHLLERHRRSLEGLDLEHRLPFLGGHLPGLGEGAPEEFLG